MVASEQADPSLHQELSIDLRNISEIYALISIIIK